MTTKNQTAIRAAESVPDSFDALQGRFLSLTSRLEVLSQALYGEAYTPNGVTPAAFVLRETTAEMGRAAGGCRKLVL